MDLNQLADGLIQYLMLIALLTFHEFGHAWTAWKCGDNTAKSLGRVSLNPVVHIDPIGTVLLPLLMLFLPSGAGRYIVGWAKPVPVNPDNLRHKKFDDILVTLAGPGMNLILAVVLVGLAKAGLVFHCMPMADICYSAARLSLLLCFFNLPHSAARWLAGNARGDRHVMGGVHGIFAIRHLWGDIGDANSPSPPDSVGDDRGDA